MKKVKNTYEMRKEVLNLLTSYIDDNTTYGAETFANALRKESKEKPLSSKKNFAATLATFAAALFSDEAFATKNFDGRNW